MMAIGENIKRLRRAKGWNQAGLADKAGLSLGQISKLERDKERARIDTIYSLINALGCTPNELLWDPDESSTDERLEMALNGIMQIEEKDKEILISIIDKYCMAVAYQKIAGKEKESFLNWSMLKGSTKELSKGN